MAEGPGPDHPVGAFRSGRRRGQTGVVDRRPSLLPGLDTLLLIGVVVVVALVIVSVVGSILAILRFLLTVGVVVVAVAVYLRLRQRRD